MGADDFTGLGSGGGTCVERCLHSGDIATDDGIAQRVADLLHWSDEFNVCGFEHRVNADDETCEPAGF
jgi:hypothetical protein